MLNVSLYQWGLIMAFEFGLPGGGVRGVLGNWQLIYSPWQLLEVEKHFIALRLSLVKISESAQKSLERLRQGWQLSFRVVKMEIYTRVIICFII